MSAEVEGKQIATLARRSSEGQPSSPGNLVTAMIIDTLKNGDTLSQDDVIVIANHFGLDPEATWKRFCSEETRVNLERFGIKREMQIGYERGERIVYYIYDGSEYLSPNYNPDETGKTIGTLFNRADEIRVLPAVQATSLPSQPSPQSIPDNDLHNENGASNAQKTERRIRLKPTNHAGGTDRTIVRAILAQELLAHPGEDLKYSIVRAKLLARQPDAQITEANLASLGSYVKGQLKVDSHLYDELIEQLLTNASEPTANTTSANGAAPNPASNAGVNSSEPASSDLNAQTVPEKPLTLDDALADTTLSNADIARLFDLPKDQISLMRRNFAPSFSNGHSTQLQPSAETNTKPPLSELEFAVLSLFQKGETASGVQTALILRGVWNESASQNDVIPLFRKLIDTGYITPEEVQLRRRASELHRQHPNWSIQRILEDCEGLPARYLEQAFEEDKELKGARRSH